MNIGVFDSGAGGLTILKEFLSGLPEYNYVYLGDNLHVPYGDRSEEGIYELTKKSVDFLFKQNCQLIILACNTATANALRKIQQVYLPNNHPDKKVLGIIRPVVEVAVDMNSRSIGVIGTSATIQSQSYVEEFYKLDSSISIFQQPCPMLATLIEEGKTEWADMDTLLQSYLKPLFANNIDSLILGCTHYELVKEHIRDIIGKHIRIISQPLATQIKLKDYLHRHAEQEKHLLKNRERKFYLTKSSSHYDKLAKIFMNDVPEFIQVNI